MRKMTHELNHRKLPYRVATNHTNGEEWLKQRDLERKNFDASPWWNYFTEKEEINIRNDDSLVLWKSCSISSADSSNEDAYKDLPYVLMLHGGGYSALTWGPMIDELSHLIVAEFGALDQRGHGESNCKDESDLSLDTVTDDITDAIKWIQEKRKFAKLGRRPLILVGHSMGGAIGVNVALKIQENSDVNLVGLIVLDVVEGSAMQALNSMQFFLRSRPQEFKSLSEAIQWCVRSGQTKNLDSARVSIPGQLKSNQGKSASLLFQPPQTSENCVIKESSENEVEAEDGLKRVSNNHGKEPSISEDHVITPNICPPPLSSPNNNLQWRIDLSKTEPYWRGWFEGMSKKFLSVKCPKLLILAGVDRLDKELTVGQMQGKFQMQVFHQVGHVVHEDIPDKVAECIASFLNRQKLVKTKANLVPCLPGC